MVFECPELVEWFETKYSKSDSAKTQALTVIGPAVEIDYQESTITIDNRKFPFPPLSVVAQELVVAGGAESVVKKRLAKFTA